MPDCVKVYPSYNESFLTFISPFFLTGMFRLGSCTITNPAEHAIEINNTLHAIIKRSSPNTSPSRVSKRSKSDAVGMKLKCLSGKHGDGSGWYENEPLGFKVERELHFFNLAVARHHRIELYSTDSSALPFKRRTDATTQPPPPICSASAGENWTYVAASCRRASKNSPNCKYTPPCRALARAQCEHKRLKSSRPQFATFFAFGAMRIVFLNVKLLSLSPPLFSSYVSEIPNFPPKWRPRVGRMSRDYRPYPWPPNHGTELPFSSGLGRWDLTLS